MLFNSLVFLVFALVFFSSWTYVRKIAWLRCPVIVAASFLFYGWWDWRFIFLIVGSGLIDFCAGIAIEKWQKRKLFFLILSLVANVGSLAIFKYLDFFIENVNAAGMAFDTGWSLKPANLILPVGISFYTFQSMSYTIDVYRGKLDATRNIMQFFAYLAMFPQLVAGPIVRASELLPALALEPNPTSADRWLGLRWMIHGYFKKMVIADTLAPVVDSAFSSSVAAESCVFWWLIAMMFAFQIYCDFSGYSDIARGLGKWMGYEFPENFNHPYAAQGFRDFWSRWHMSLSTWFRDYVYIPLGGSKKGEARGHLNMWITMVVSGMWHGASWTFVVWGALHAFYLSVERVTKWPVHFRKIPFFGKLINVAITFVLALIAWVFFRAESIDQAFEVLSRMFDFGSLDIAYAKNKLGKMALLVLGLAIVRELFFVLSLDKLAFFKKPIYDNIRIVMFAVAIVLIVLFRGPGQAFVYFQF